MVLEAFEAKAYYTTLAPSASLRLLLQNKKIYIYIKQIFVTKIKMTYKYMYKNFDLSHMYSFIVRAFSYFPEKSKFFSAFKTLFFFFARQKVG